MSRSSRKRILVAYGTRPEAIKLAPLIVALKRYNEFEVQVVCTGQHTKLLDGILEIWGIVPDEALHNPKGNSIIANPALIMNGISEVLARYHPDLVVVQGDTATAFATTVQAHVMRIPVAHVEAGLRSEDIWNPWPEEAFRRSIDAMSSYHFAPTRAALNNLVREGLGSTSLQAGNTVVDSLNFVVDVLNRDTQVRSKLEKKIPFDLSGTYILFTQHRREGFGVGQDRVFNAVKRISESGLRVVFPVHLNPQVQTRAHEFFSNSHNVSLIEPLNYLEFIELLRNCALVISDSGGLQEEVPTFGKSILITRLTTERPEVVESGYGFLMGYDEEEIVKKSLEICRNTIRAIPRGNPYGNGDASTRISQFLKEKL